MQNFTLSKIQNCVIGQQEEEGEERDGACNPPQYGSDKTNRLTFKSCRDAIYRVSRTPKL